MMRRSWTPLIFYILLLSLTAGLVFLSRRPFSSGNPPDAVVLFTLDACRWDAFPRSCGGRTEDAELPHLAGFCRRARVFPHAYAPAAATWASLSSLYTGLLPPLHAVSAKRLFLSPGFTTLAEHYRAAGYRTMVISANRGVLGRRMQLIQGFDLAVNSIPNRFIGELGRFFDPKMIHRAAMRDPRTVVSLAVEGMEHICPRCFAHIHLFQPHAPYGAPVPLLMKSGLFPGGLPRNPDLVEIDDSETLTVSRRLMNRLKRWYRKPGGEEATPEEQKILRQLYRAGVLWADRAFGEFLRYWNSRPWSANAVLVLTSDHGEAFGEHGYWMHAVSVYEETVHVPLAIQMPHGTSGVSNGLVSLTDLFWTLVRRIRPHLRVHPQNSLDLLGRPPSRRRWTAAFAGDQRMIRSGRYKLVYRVSSGIGELYDMVTDPDEQRDLLPYRIELGEKLLAALQETLYRDPDPTATPTARVPMISAYQELRALGYVGVPKPPRPPALRVAPRRLDPDAVRYRYRYERPAPDKAVIRLTNTGRAVLPSTASRNGRGSVILTCRDPARRWQWTGRLRRDLRPGAETLWVIPVRGPLRPRCRLRQVGIQDFPGAQTGGE